jgi:hypothetical protein
MTLRDLVTCIVWSSPGDWNKIRGHPSYRDKFTLHETSGGDRFGFQVQHPDAVAAYKPDLSITMAWGLDVNENFQEPWTQQFPNPNASSHYVDVFYNGALVLRKQYVSVDGGLAMVPLSLARDQLVVPVAYYMFITLLDHLTWSMPARPPDYFERAGLQIVNTPWPEEAPIEHDGIRGLDLRATGEGTGPTR